MWFFGGGLVRPIKLEGRAQTHVAHAAPISASRVSRWRVGWRRGGRGGHVPREGLSPLRPLPTAETEPRAPERVVALVLVREIAREMERKRRAEKNRGKEACGGSGGEWSQNELVPLHSPSLLTALNVPVAHGPEGGFAAT